MAHEKHLGYLLMKMQLNNNWALDVTYIHTLALFSRIAHCICWRESRLLKVIFEKFEASGAQSKNG